MSKVAKTKKWTIGDVVDYKLIQGRGRPCMGKIIKHSSGAFILEDYALKQTRVPPSKIIREHIVKYQRKSNAN